MRRKIEKIKDAVYGRGYVYNIHYHLIWVTKYRRECFTTPELREEMKNILFYISKVAECVIEQAEVMPDHVHLMISIPPKYSISDIMKNLKGSSARFFFSQHPDLKKDKFWGGHLWSPSYYIGTVGNMSKETVAKYIQNQYKKEKALSSHE